MSISDHGLVSYNPATGLVRDYIKNEISHDLYDKVILSMYVDFTGILWIGTYFDGVIKLVPLINSFKHYGSDGVLPAVRTRGGVTAILEDSRGYLWLGTRFGGLYRIDRRTNKYTVYQKQPDGANGLSSNNILSIAELCEGNKQVVWIGTNGGGLNRFEPETGRFKVYRRSNGLPGSQANNAISGILPYDKDHLVIGTQSRDMGDGIDIFNLRTGNFINLKYSSANIRSLSSNNVLVLYKDRSDTVWVGTRNGGLNKLVVKNINAKEPDSVGCFVRYMNNPDDPGSLNNNTVYAIHEDAQNNLWIGTSIGGLNNLCPLFTLCKMTRHAAFGGLFAAILTLSA